MLFFCLNENFSCSSAVELQCFTTESQWIQIRWEEIWTLVKIWLFLMEFGWKFLLLRWSWPVVFTQQSVTKPSHHSQASKYTKLMCFNLKKKLKRDFSEWGLVGNFSFSAVTGRVVQFELILELIRNFFKNSVLLQTFVIPKLLRCLFLHSLEHFDECRSVSQF